MQNKTTIKCSNCQAQININEILYHQLEEELQQKNLVERQELEAEHQKREEAFKKAGREQLKLEKQKLYNKLKEEIQEEQSNSMTLLKKELREKSEQVKELHVSQIEIERLKREKDEVEFKVKAEAEITITAILKEEKEKISRAFEEKNELKLREKDEQLEQIKRDLESANRKAEQGSMQVQGEALEFAIESWLESQFPFDSIEAVKKGAFGADCVQIVHTREIPNCGVICYESKNTKAWSEGWIGKLKQDMLKVNADIGVLVTSVYPKEMKRMGFIEGIWVCSLEEFKGSVSLLRASLIRAEQTAQKEENRSDKMSLLYSYMTGNEFSMQMKAIVDGFIKMQEELDKEKRSLMATWKRRQKIIDGVLANTTEMVGALQGIAGSSVITSIEALELPYDEDDDLT
ncbi:MAG TPA: DUF2130 domain-containing protein [Campylobacterales bacterium]|nr:DUF2130 domain-containing protein [Campylobacterales bacterium]HIP41681.1 DUF2130 domain-containing protein [Campylobacterales bacterium]